jgi:predicted RNase H-like HicB family nuclease
MKPGARSSCVTARATSAAIIYEQAEDGAWGAHSPDVDGVFALGQARREAESRMAEALTAHLAHLRASGRPIPDPHTDAGRIAA